MMTKENPFYKIVKSDVMENFNTLISPMIEGIKDDLDKADMDAVFKRWEVVDVGVGISHSKSNRPKEAVKDALSHLFNSIDIIYSYGCLLSFSLNRKDTIKEVEESVELIKEILNPEVRILWVSEVNPSLKEETRVLVVFTS